MFRAAPVRSAAKRSLLTARTMATVSPVSPAARSHKVVVVGGGSAGVNISHQLLRTGKFSQDDIAVVDPATLHHYQPGWTLVGAGLKTTHELERPMASLMDPQLKFYQQGVSAFAPEENTVTLANGAGKLSYEQLVVAPGIALNWGAIKGLPEALAHPDSPVTSIYGYDTAPKVFPAIQRMKKGMAIFTQPAGVVKCAGAPQKIMWLALDYWKKQGLYDGGYSSSPVKIGFATGLPVMFGVPKYSAKLESLRRERAVEGWFTNDLVAVDAASRTATFALPEGKGQVTRQYDFMHVVPKMGPHGFVSRSPLANAAGFVDVDDATLRHKKFANVWSAGDASSCPTSKTAAAAIAESPVLVRNLLQAMEGKAPDAAYDGYTSCPLPTEYGKLLLAEFKYAGVPKETFGDLIGFDQAEPRAAFWYMKKHFFPWVYYNSMVKGQWAGPKGWMNN